MKTVGIISLGCPKNLVDTEVMLGLLEKNGYKIVNDPADAEIIIVNTCSFIEDAKKESIDAILEMAKFKISGFAKYLIVTGCLPQRYKDELIQLFPEVDLFVGTGEFQKIVKLIDGLNRNKSSLCKQGSLSVNGTSYLYSSKTPRKIATVRHAVYIKIAEGCFHACSFCAIPKIRGKYKSREAKDIVNEAEALLKNGAKELNLIAQDTTAYGRDLRSKTDLSGLLRGISLLRGEKWIRFLYAYPQSFTKKLLTTIRDHGDICKYVDVPVQHIDNDILFSMRRGKSEAKVRKVIEDIRTELPQAAIRTSVIVGFPGETDKKFHKLIKYIEEVRFDNLGAFVYSEEEGTSSAKMRNCIPEKIKNERKKEVMRLQKKISGAKLKEKIGSTLKVLVDAPLKGDQGAFIGRSEFQAPEIDGVIYVKGGKVKPGNFYSVEITGAYDYDLTGKVV